MLTDRVERWRREGAMEDVLGRRLFVWRREGDGPLLLFLHGFPSCSYDWRELLGLWPGAAALAFDCLGFGLSDKPRDHVYSLAWQADAAEELVRRCGSPPVFLVAHDMGTSVATVDVLAGLRALRPGVEVVELPGAGHYPQIECPERIASALDTALARASTA